jgi:hypothetical protein
MARIRSVRLGAHTSLRFTGRLTASDMGRLEHACGDALTRTPLSLQLDLRAVTGIDQTALALLQRLEQRGATMVGARPQDLALVSRAESPRRRVGGGAAGSADSTPERRRYAAGRRVSAELPMFALQPAVRPRFAPRVATAALALMLAGCATKASAAAESGIAMRRPVSAHGNSKYGVSDGISPIVACRTTDHRLQTGSSADGDAYSGYDRDRF